VRRRSIGSALKTKLGPGDFVRFPGDVPHVYQALGGPARGVLVMSHP
jgi:hypothetical protein